MDHGDRTTVEGDILAWVKGTESTDTKLKECGGPLGIRLKTKIRKRTLFDVVALSFTSVPLIAILIDLAISRWPLCK